MVIFGLFALLSNPISGNAQFLRNLIAQFISFNLIPVIVMCYLFFQEEQKTMSCLNSPNFYYYLIIRFICMSF